MGRRGHTHVRGRPAGIATRLGFIGLIGEGHRDRPTAGVRDLGGCQCGGEPCRALADNDQITELLAHESASFLRVAKMHA